MKKQVSNRSGKPKGFAAMNPKDVQRICSMGGKAVVAKHGSKHMARIGKAGGMA